jgi:glutaryl-CoA dehydrogenase
MTRTSVTKGLTGHFEWDGPLLLGEQLSEEEAMICQTARDFAQRSLLPRVAAAYLNETADTRVFQELGSVGLLGVTIPTEYGGAAAWYVSYGIVACEIERIDSGYRSWRSYKTKHSIYKECDQAQQERAQAEEGRKRMTITP